MQQHIYCFIFCSVISSIKYFSILLITFYPYFVWLVKFVLSISMELHSFSFKITHNYAVIFFKVIRRKQDCKISQFFTCKHKINESNAKVAAYYWIVCLYLKNVWHDLFMPDKFYNFFRNILNTKTIKINDLLFVTKENNTVCTNICIFIKVYYISPIFYFFRQIISRIAFGEFLE